MRGLALKLYPVRRIILTIGIVDVFLLAYFIFSSDKNLDAYILPLASTFVWCLALYGIAISFYKPTPIISDSDNFLTRVTKRVALFLSWLCAVTFCLITLLLFYLSYKTFSYSLMMNS